MQAAATAIGCRPESDSKTLLLRTPHTFVSGQRNQPEPVWRLPLQGLASQCQDMLCRRLEENQPCLTADPVQQFWPPGHRTQDCVEANDVFVIRLLAHSTGRKFTSGACKPSKTQGWGRDRPTGKLLMFC